MNPNAYCLKLPSHICTTDVFNVKHLIPYHGDSLDDDVVGNLRVNFLHPGESDAVYKDLTYMEWWDRQKSL